MYQKIIIAGQNSLADFAIAYHVKIISFSCKKFQYFKNGPKKVQ